jgi:hypothetical protein
MPKKKGNNTPAKTPQKQTPQKQTPSKSGGKKSGKKEVVAPSMEVSSPGKSTGGHDRTKWAGSATMGVAPTPEQLPLPKFLGRVAKPLLPQTPPLQGNGSEDSFSIHEKLQLLAGGGPPAVPAHVQPTVAVPRNYDPDAPALEDLAAAAVPRNYDPDAPVPAAPDGVPRNYSTTGEMPQALSAVGLAAAGW